MNALALTRGARVGLKLYSGEEFEELIQKSQFGVHGTVEKTSLLGIPIFICLKLWKPAREVSGGEED